MMLSAVGKGRLGPSTISINYFMKSNISCFEEEKEGSRPTTYYLVDDDMPRNFSQTIRELKVVIFKLGKTLPMSGMSAQHRESKIDAPEKKGSIGSDTADTNRGFVQTNFANQLFAASK